LKAPERGNRKFAAQRDALLILTGGTLALAYMGVAAEIHAGFVAGVAAVNGGFMWGNSRTHAAAAQEGGQ
jgi:hypothetical protein